MKVTALTPTALLQAPSAAPAGEEALRRLIARAGIESPEDSDADSE